MPTNNIVSLKIHIYIRTCNLTTHIFLPLSTTQRNFASITLLGRHVPMARLNTHAETENSGTRLLTVLLLSTCSTSQFTARTHHISDHDPLRFRQIDAYLSTHQGKAGMIWFILDQTSCLVQWMMMFSKVETDEC